MKYVNQLVTKLLLSIFFVFIPSLIFSQVWNQKANYSGGTRQAASGFSIGNKGYLGVGYNGTFHTDFWEFDPATNVWTQKANYGGAGRFGATSFSVGNKGYIGMGSIGYPVYNYVLDFWEYDPAANTWVQKASFPGTGRYTTTSFVIGNKGYTGMGWNGSLFRDIWEYDPALDAWTQKANFGGTSRQSAAAFVLNGKAYVGTGHDGSNKNDLWEYNPVTNSWLQKANYPGAARYGAGAFTLGNLGYLGTGGNGSVFYSDFYKYDDVSNTWTAAPAFPGAAVRHSVTYAIDSCAYLATGVSSVSATNQMWSLCFACTVNANFSGANGVCVNSNLSLTNTSVGASSVLWDFGDGFTSSDTAGNINHAYSTAGSFTIKLIAYNACGNDTDSMVVNVSPLPLIVASNDTVICAGSTVFLTASGALSFQWMPSAGLNTTTGSQVMATPSASTAYTVIGTDANNCSNSISILLTVNPLPSLVTSPDTQICANSSTMLSASGAVSYLWSPPFGLNTTTWPDVIANPFNTTTYTVTGTDSNNCSSSSTITVTVNPIPDLRSSADTLLCFGDSTTLLASGAASYQWIPSTYLNTDTGSQVVTTPAATIIYTVYGYSINNCVDQNIIAITVQPLPPSAVTPAGPINLCGQPTITLSANYYMFYNYQWYYNNAIIPGSILSQLNVSAAGTYKVQETDIRGCSSFSNEVELLSGTSNISASITSSAANNCSPNTIYSGYGPQNILLTAIAPGAASYLWSTGATTQSISVSTAGTYNVIVTDSSGCKSILTPLSQIEIHVIDIRCGNDLKKVTLCHVPPGNAGNPQTICVSPSAIASHLANHPGDCLGPCSTANQRLAAGISIGDIEVSAYPNPFASYFTLHFDIQNEIQINIIDYTGRIVESYSNPGLDFQYGMNLKNGVYFIEITSEDLHRILKVVKAD